MNNFITYSQNFEDLMLWRALQHVKEGFYIDVGAAHPDEHSVTRAFYDRGWRGINIEPAPEHFTALIAARERDITLCCLAGAMPCSRALYHFVDTGLSTTEAAIAARHISNGREAQQLEVPVRTLAEICRELAPTDVHFLKVDVEGAEEAVLRGADFVAVRPWIIVVEATQPLSTTESWHGWEPILEDAGYRFIWFDGLNRFYLAGEHWNSLRHAFAVPPNVYDCWIYPQDRQHRALLNHAQFIADSTRNEIDANRAKLVAALQDAKDLRTKLNKALHDATTLRAQFIRALRAADAARAALASTEAATAEARTTVDRMRRSTSWRMTAPVRTLGGFLRRLLLGSHAWLTLRPGSRPRRMARQSAVIVAQFLLARPYFAYPAKRLLRRLPPVEHRLKSMLTPPTTCVAPTWKVPYLTRHASRIYDELKIATERGTPDAHRH